MVNIGTLQKLVNFNEADAQLIQQHRAALYQQIDDINRRFNRWLLDEAGWHEDGPPPILPTFIESILHGHYGSEFSSQQYQQALYWYRNGFDATTSIAASSQLRSLLHDACMRVEQEKLAMSICKVVDISQAILSVVHHIAGTHQRLRHNVITEKKRILEISKSISDENANHLGHAYIEHLNWKLRAYSLALGHKLDTRDLQLSPDECVLGRWLDDGGLQTINVDVRSGLISAHHRLHQIAKQILALSEADEPENMVDYLMEMESASKEVTLILNNHIEQALWKLATIDSLTGIGNRRGFLNELNRKIKESERSRTGFGLLFLDVDHFKKVNDLHGHSIGDEVLKSITDRIKGTLRASDICYRWGGEEFVILVSTEEKEGALNVAERILRAMNETPVSSSEGPFEITVSIGCIFKSADLSFTEEELVAQADHAMMSAKKQGRNRIFCHYDDSDH